MVKEKGKNINNELSNYYFSYLSPGTMLKRLSDASGEKK